MLRLGWVALPLGLVMMLIALTANIPPLFVERYLGERDLGIYAVAASFVIVGHILLTSAGQATSPSLAVAFAEHNRSRALRLFAKLLACAVFIGLAGIGVSIIAGEFVLFDRSWYNRAGVERVMGFCTPEEHRRFLRQCPQFERMLIDDGIILIKYWFSVSDEEQERRFQARIDDPLKE